MQPKYLIRLALITAGLLAIPFFGNMYVEGWNWSPFDFVFAAVLIFGTGFLFELARLKAANSAYKIAAALALAGAFLLIWINGAVGIIGDSDINMLYALVVFTLFIGAIVARLEASGMARTLFAAALIQALVPVIAFVVKTPDFSPGVMQVFMLNTFWVMVFAGSALLFRQAAVQGTASRA